MSPEEAKKKMEDLASLISYEQNLIARSNGYADSKQTADTSKESLKGYNKEMEELRKYL